VHNTREDDTTRRMASSLHPYIERNPKNWYVDQEMCRGTVEWRTLQHNIVLTLSFEQENPNIDSTLKHIIGEIFIDEP
jgi:hypothetical protein